MYNVIPRRNPSTPQLPSGGEIIDAVLIPDDEPYIPQRKSKPSLWVWLDHPMWTALTVLAFPVLGLVDWLNFNHLHSFGLGIGVILSFSSCILVLILAFTKPTIRWDRNPDGILYRKCK